MKEKILRAVNRLSNEGLTYSLIEKQGHIYIATCDQNRSDKIIINTNEPDFYHVDIRQDGETIPTGMYLQGFNWWKTI